MTASLNYSRTSSKAPISASQIKNSIIKTTLDRNQSEKVKSLSNKEAEVIQFEIKVCYSLNPEEYSDMCIGSDIDSTQVFQR